MDHPYSGGNWMTIPSHNQNPNPNTTTATNPPNMMMMINQEPSYRHHQQQQQHHHQSLASHFHLLHLVEKLADAVESGTRDQNSDALVNELTNHFDKCQQLLNSISGSINSKVVTVEGQKHKLEESEHLLNQRRDLIAKYRNSVEELVKSDYNR
ncbi:mediator of RNA polymerase II transcription subunit-like protein [Tasmannia lanceolata]|uniref:mediator of RNA polymerase II transcription subunit-like protein n=1 Tax=Tasmannia lanceolata TaxID=3420 RepID=UPI004063F534